MNPLFHRAYDKFLIAITPDYQIVISDKMFSETKSNLFLSYLQTIQGHSIIMPEKFSPDKELLAKHYECYRNSI